MTSFLRDDYPLERSYLGSSRLYFQHYLWERLLGHLLNPCIPRTEDMKIADIACGTGIWLLDLAKELAQENIPAQLHGYDISTEMYPPSGWLPHNVKLDTFDFFKPIPRELVGQYDAIHLRLVALVIQNGDPTPVLDNLLTMLKPGGYIQWDDPDMSGIYCSSCNAEASTENLEKLRTWLYTVCLSQFPSFRWITKLGQIFESRDMTVLQDQALKHGDDITYAWNMVHMMGLAELVKIVAGGEKEGYELLDKAAEEMRRGGSISFGFVSVVARKAGGD